MVQIDQRTLRAEPILLGRSSRLHDSRDGPEAGSFLSHHVDIADDVESLTQAVVNSNDYATRLILVDEIAFTSVGWK
jgi:hypothetical protein